VAEAGDYLLDFLERAALDGHTVTPIAVAGSILSSRSLQLEDALADLGPSGRGLVAVTSESLLGLRRLVDAELAVVAAIYPRVAAGTLSVVTGPSGASRDELAGSVGGSRPALLDDAERLDVETFAAFFASCSDDETAVLAGDLDELGSFGAGRAFADIAGSGVVATRSVTVEAGSVLEHFVAGVRAGGLTAPDDPGRSVVAVQVGSWGEATHRVGQLTQTSIPRALGIAAADVQVLAVSDAAASALQQPVADAGGPPPLTVPLAVGRSYPAVVLVLGPTSSGLVTRQLVYSAVRRAQQHVSIVNATGAALAEGVRERLARPRRTLLSDQLSSGSHSRSSSSDSSSESSRPSTGPNGVTSS
jgi:hypothetical protein